MRRVAFAAALGLAFAGACRSTPSEDVALRWLASDCAWSREESLAALRREAGRVEPVLLHHLRSGPPVSVTSRAREAYAYEYGVVERLGRGQPLSFPVVFESGEREASFAVLLTGREAWVTGRLESLAEAWRARALLGLELLGTPQAVDALAMAASDEGEPYEADAGAALQRARVRLAPP